MSTAERPLIKLQLTITDKILEVVGLLVLLGFWFFMLSHYTQLPDIIPTHFGGGGKPDGYGSKWTIIMLPIVGTLLYTGLTIVSRFPHKFNYTATITQANAEKQYSIMVRMIRVMKTMVLLTFFVLDYQTTQIALGLPDIFGNWFLFLLFAMIFVPLFYFLIQSSKNS
ncbi:DUF1648 domain-containing protein [Flavobacterium terrisoli]|uniref:DUF1648 domain-containing protein n=1 Tax=Flavobacterium terrisoli TaxID=3242195 RepID=UPI002543EF54|nr:DUF1648 domain-containing protein [Flavobacterium buctense]